jgi:mycofactocin glycosyltransferase
MAQPSEKRILIPLIYRLREEVLIKTRADCALVVCDSPLFVVRISLRAAHILKTSDGTQSISQISSKLGVTENTVLTICEYFNSKGILETVKATNPGFFPSITVIVPVRDRQDEIGQCLESIFGQNYPQGLIDVIVVNDGSADDTAKIASSFPCKLVSLDESHGQSYCRNLGARQAQGDIIAFLDSDCVASSTWLKELTTYFQWEQMGIVGGRVDGFYDQSPLDRYEKTFSSLAMGKYFIHAKNDKTQAYVPTCNLLVRKNIFREVGGIKDDMAVGEDVDFCWRVRKAGHDLLYVPSGSVAHKHRNSLPRMLLRRTDYGTSEAILYQFHPDKKKTFQIRLFPVLAMVAIISALATLSAIPLIFPPLIFFAEALGKIKKIRSMSREIPFRTVLYSVVRAHMSFCYFVAFHLVRYYLIALLILALFVPSLWLVLIFLVALVSVIDFTVKHPKLDYVRFLFYSLLEHVFYQAGVFIGCLRKKAFGSYLPRFHSKLRT